jgi:branched-chain amino acid aminotransferase
MKTVYLNKRFIPLNKAKISVLDRGFLYGDGVFETMRSRAGVVERLDEHIRRLFSSLEAMDIRINMSRSGLKSLTYKTLRKNKINEAYIKVVVARGIGKGLLEPSGRAVPTVLIYVEKLKKAPPEIYEKGIKICVSSVRNNEQSFKSGKKTLNYLDNIASRLEARRKGFADAVLLNVKGFVSEATSSNIFIVKRGKLFTPCKKCGILPGITRGEVVRAAGKNLKLKVKEVFMKTSRLYTADEVFLTNSLAGIIPVVVIGKRRIGSGVPGPITKKLMREVNW